MLPVKSIANSRLNELIGQEGAQSKKSFESNEIGLKKYVPSEGLVNRNNPIGPRVMLRLYWLYASLAWNLEKFIPGGIFDSETGGAS